MDTYGAHALMAAWEARVTDERPRLATGLGGIDDDLHRGGFAPGELVILGGRTHTRKTTVALNMMSSMLGRGLRVGFVALDETIPGYAAKLVSVITGLTMQDLEERWDATADRRQVARDRMRLLSVLKSPRPSFERLTAWVEDTCSIDLGAPPQVVFIDYASLMARDEFAGSDVQRIPRLFEDLQVWTNEHEVVTIVIHQVSRGDRGREHLPMTLDNLKYGGEEYADVVLATYRPALDPLGNMSWDEARAAKVDEDDWHDAKSRVEQYRDVTFLQLLKNRPGVHLNQQGVMLKSPNESLNMVVVADDALHDTHGKVVNLHG